MSSDKRIMDETFGSDHTPGSAPGAGSNARWMVMGICVFLAVITLAVFGKTLRYEFVNFDDGAYVYENPAVTSGLTPNGVGQAIIHGSYDNWDPVTTISHMLDCQLFGLWAGGHHLTNVLLHMAAAICLFLVLRRMTAMLWRSAFVAAVFAIHPLHVESVAWVTERKDVLSGLFFMLTIGAYVHYAEHVISGMWQVTGTKKAVSTPDVSRVTCHSSPFYGLTLLFFALGLMSKAMLVTLPFVLLLLDYWPLNRFTRPVLADGRAGQVERPGNRSVLLRLLVEKIPLLALSLALCAATIFAQREYAIQPLANYPLSLRIGNALTSYVIYLWQMIYPARLANFYPYPVNGLPLWEIVLAVLLLAAISAGVFFWRRKHPYLLVGWLWYLGMLAPVIGFLQVGSQARADRYTYLPQIGLYLALTWAVAELSASWRFRRQVLGVSAVIVITALMVRAFIQTAYWRNSESLWTHTLACTSNNAIAHLDLGNALFKKGQVDEAIVHYRKTLEIQPDDVEVHYNLGNALLQEGQVDESIIHYRKILEFQPDHVMAHIFLGNALNRKGQVDDAIAEYRRVVELKPDSAEAYYALGTACVQKGQLDEGAVDLQKALELKPDFADAHYRLGNVLLLKGQVDEAIAHYQKALEIEPDDAAAHNNLATAFSREGRFKESVAHYQRAVELKPDAPVFRNDLAWVLATSPDASVRDGGEAVRQAGQANQLAGGNNPWILRTLAAAYAEAGKFPEAVATAEQALQLATAQNNTALVSKLQLQISLYRKGSPFHNDNQINTSNQP